MKWVLWALLLLVPGVALAGGYCGSSYRPTTYYTATVYAPTYTPYYAPTYYREYYPVALEVQVYQNRSYALSDLTRDKLMLEMWDTIRSRYNSLESKESPSPARESTGAYREPERASAAPRASQGARKAYAKTSAAAAKVLSESCVSCHGKGSEHGDFSDPDAVPMVLRRAAFGMCIAGDMPQPPGDLRAAGKEKELDAYKAEHRLAEAALNDLYSGWVSAPVLAKK